MNKIDLVDNNNIGVSDLSRKKLHIKCKSILDNNYVTFVFVFLYCDD